MKKLHKLSVGRLFVLIVFIASFLAAGLVMPGKSQAAGALLSGAAGEFTPVSPSRIFDTRTGLGAAVPGPIGRGYTIIQVTGRGGIPADGVDSVVMNVTVTGSTASSYLTIWPYGADRPTISNLNFVAGQTVPNQVTVKVGAGKIQVYNDAGTAHVILDIAGYYATTTGTPGSRYHPINPPRMVDTRTGTGGISGPIGRGPTTAQVVNSSISSQDGLLLSEVKAVTVNITVTGPNAASYLSAWPAGEAKPLASNLNYTAGQTVANLVTVKVNANGQIQLYNDAGTAHVIIDLVGYYGKPYSSYSQWGRYVSVTPRRILDTRSGIGTDVFYECNSPPSLTAPYWPVTQPCAGGPAFQFGYRYPEAPVGTRPLGVITNMTVTQPTQTGYLHINDNGPNTSSSVNFVAGQTVSNATANTSTGGYGDIETIQISVSSGSAHVITDLFGFFVRE